jgi:hypothetical protein
MARGLFKFGDTTKLRLTLWRQVEGNMVGDTTFRWLSAVLKSLRGHHTLYRQSCVHAIPPTISKTDKVAENVDAVVERGNLVTLLTKDKEIGRRIDNGRDKMPLVASAMDALGLALRYKSKCLA